MKCLAAGNLNGIVGGMDGDTHALEVIGDRRDTIGLLDAQFAGIANNQAFLTGSAKNGEDGNFVDHGGGRCTFDDASTQAR